MGTCDANVHILCADECCCCQEQAVAHMQSVKGAPHCHMGRSSMACHLLKPAPVLVACAQGTLAAADHHWAHSCGIWKVWDKVHATHQHVEKCV